MRIFYDGAIYSMQKAGGINRYFANLISRLPDNFHPTLSAEGTSRLNFPSHSNLRLHNTKRFDFRPRRLSHRLQRYYTDTATDARRFDLVHPTYYGSLTGKDFASVNCPVVLTVYDMIHELFPDSPELIDTDSSHARTKRSAILAAQAIICISENTKKDLIEHYCVPEDRISVTYLASEIDATFSQGSEDVPERPYFLYVGSRSSYKNFDGLLSAFAKVAAINRDAALAVVGSQFTQSEERMLATLKVADRVQHYGHVNDRQLAKLYRCSLAFVYPSLYEGFGIPPLEAMACGTLVIASDCSSIPEVVGDAGLLFDPYSSSALTEAMLSVFDESSRRDALIKKGIVRAKQFTWEKTVSQTLAVYTGLTQ